MLNSIGFSFSILLASASFVSATSQCNVTINDTDPSILYWPPTSWTLITASTDDETQLQHKVCIPDPGATYHIALSNPSGEGGEEPTRVVRFTHPDSGNENDDWPTRARSSMPHRRMGGESAESDAMAQGRSESLFWPMTLRFKFIGEYLPHCFIPRYCLLVRCSTVVFGF